MLLSVPDTWLAQVPIDKTDTVLVSWSLKYTDTRSLGNGLLTLGKTGSHGTTEAPLTWAGACKRASLACGEVFSKQRSEQPGLGGE